MRAGVFLCMFSYACWCFYLCMCSCACLCISLCMCLCVCTGVFLYVLICIRAHHRHVFAFNSQFLHYLLPACF
uniref:Uncharacterized protein n=1 Tax=Rhizophora mucronata TaxID=61149 RepID=A0A2P2Q4J3_RHIMU